jgi:hypothetical protein
MPAEIATAEEHLAEREKMLADILAKLPAAEATADAATRAWPNRQLQFVLAGDMEGLSAGEDELRAATKFALALREARATAEVEVENARDELFRTKHRDQIGRCKTKIKILFKHWHRLDEIVALYAAEWEKIWEATRDVRDCWPGGIQRTVNRANGPLDQGALLNKDDMIRALRIGLYHVSGIEFISSQHNPEGAPQLPGAKPKDYMHARREDNPSIADAAAHAEEYLLRMASCEKPSKE